MLIVDRVVLREIRLPLVEPFRISSGVVSERRILLAELTSTDGATAWAECVAGEAPNYSAETVDTAWLAIERWAAPRLLGVPLATPDAAHAALQQGFVGHPMAKATLEMGAWALAAEREGVALARLLGGVRERVEVGISLGIQATPADLVKRAQAAFSRGYRRVKLKIRPDADLPFVAAVRDAVGSRAVLSVDANGAYTPADAERLARLDAFDLLMLEQPFPAGDLVRHAALQQRLRTDLCLDESVDGAERAADALALGAARIINIKPGRVGGLAASRAIHELCQAQSVPVWCGGMLESGIGRACNVALATLPGFTIPGDISPSDRYWAEDIVDPPWTMRADGTMAVPMDRPGLGVRVDVARIEALTARRVELRA
ncbi:MAG: o-succinylbenzoate synthase [Gemmatimonadota bacterium]